MAHAAASHVSHEEPVAPGAHASGDAGGWLLALVLMLATTAFTLWALLAPRAELPPLPPAAAVPADAPAAGGLGPVVERPLAGGASIHVPERGVEGRLLAFIQDPDRRVDKDTWFDFDRLTFDTGAATLQPSSHDQLAAVAAILAAFPAVKLKIGGYTDDVGDRAFNQRLSDDRAANVRAALVERGVATDRLEAEGYGEQFPVGDNATPEGRARNRRISMRVTEK